MLGYWLLFGGTLALLDLAGGQLVEVCKCRCIRLRHHMHDLVTAHLKLIEKAFQRLRRCWLDIVEQEDPFATLGKLCQHPAF